MTHGSASREFAEFNDQARRRWNDNAEWWDDRIGDGNDFQCELIEPATERLLGIRPGEVVLDVACGAGRFARRLAELGARVVAFDFSERFIARARRRTEPGAAVDYHVIDAAEPGRVAALGAARFDGAVATMCLMDMAMIEPLLAALGEVLKPGGRFVFTVMHPCFQPPQTPKFAESIDAGGQWQVACGVKVSRYRTPAAWEGIGICGQPRRQCYFHRPLAVLLGAGFRAGFVVDGLEEPTFDAAGAKKGSLRWRDMPEIPPVLAVRMRPAGRPTAAAGAADSAGAERRR